MKKDEEVSGGRKTGHRFNLLFEGTGIRFRREDDSPAEKPVDIYSRALRTAFLILLLILTASYLVSLYEFYPADTPEPATQNASPPIHGSAKELPTVEVAGNETPTLAKDTQQPTISAPQPVVAVPAPPTPAENYPQGKMTRPLVRFGVFLSRTNAEKMLATLRQKEISALVEEELRPMPAYTIESEPVTDEAAMEKAMTVLKKFNVALMGAVEPKYLVVGPIWLKEQALEAAQKARQLGLKISITEERMEKVVYGVVSPPFETVELAQHQADEWRTQGVDGLIEGQDYGK